MTGLASIVPACRHGAADSVKTWERWHLTEPATDEDRYKVVGITWGKNLGHGARVEFVDHLAVAVLCRLKGVSLELIALGQRSQAHLGSVFADNAHVAGVTAGA